MDFLSSIGNEFTGQAEPDEEVAKASVNLVGDICSCMHVSVMLGVCDSYYGPGSGSLLWHGFAHVFLA